MYFKMKGKREKLGEPDWRKSKIYMIQSESDIPPYIGYTTQNLNDRLMDHKYNMEHGKYDGSELHLRTGTGEIVLVEKYGCNERDDIVGRYEWFLENYENCNKVKG